MPDGMEIAEDVHVRVTGYFFKLEGYLAPSGAHVAPVLLAGEIERLPQFATRIQRANLTPYFIAAICAVTLSLGVMFWRFKVSDATFARGTLKRTTTAPQAAIDALAGIEPDDPNEIFRRLAEADAAEAERSREVTAE
jgi:hypothetical protein